MRQRQCAFRIENAHLTVALQLMSSCSCHDFERLAISRAIDGMVTLRKRCNERYPHLFLSASDASSNWHTNLSLFRLLECTFLSPVVSLLRVVSRSFQGDPRPASCPTLSCRPSFCLQLVVVLLWPCTSDFLLRCLRIHSLSVSLSASSQERSRWIRSYSSVPYASASSSARMIGELVDVLL